jgi:hypothetical protein
VIARRRTAILVSALAISVACGALAVVWRWKAPSYVRQRLEQLTGHRVAVGSVSLSYRLEIVAHDVRIAGAPPFQGQTLARAERALVRLGGPGGFWTPSEIVVEGLDVEYLATGSGDNVRSAGDTAGRGPTVARAKERARLTRVVIRNARLHGTIAPPYGPRLSFRVGDAELVREASGAVSVAFRKAAIDAQGWATVRAQELEAHFENGQLKLASPQPIAIDVPGGGTLIDGLALRSTVTTTSVDCELSTARSGGSGLRLHALVDQDSVDLNVDAHAIPLRALGAVALRSTFGLEKATANLHWSFVLDRSTLLADYLTESSVADIDFVHPGLDVTPWRDQSLALRLRGQIDFAHQRVKVTEGALAALAATLNVSGVLDVAHAVRGSLVFATPSNQPLSCAGLLHKQAPPVRQALAGLVLDGKLGVHLALDFDASNWEDLRLDIDVDPICKVRSEPRVLADMLPDLRKPPKVGDGITKLPLGPIHPDFVPLSQMPRHLTSAFLTSEDSKFFRHHGFDVDMIRRALAQDLENHSFERGASTITQQLAKNLFLTHKRTLARKLEEAVLTWRLQKLLSKDRVLEIYLNVIELGPGIRGVKQAARKYFGKDVASLTPLESAHLAALTPNPHALARRFRDGTVDEGWQQRLYDLLGMMKRHGRLSAEELATARASKLQLRDLSDDAALRGKQ